MLASDYNVGIYIQKCPIRSVLVTFVLTSINLFIIYLACVFDLDLAVLNFEIAVYLSGYRRRFIKGHR